MPLRTAQVFPDRANGTDAYANARSILARTCPGDAELHDLVVRMISLVSASGNGNGKDDVTQDEPWVLWPRYADRLEALGAIGVHRAISYANKGKRMFALPSTPRVSNTVDAMRVATPERFAAYVMQTPFRSAGANYDHVLLITCCCTE
jgi:HD superfamily phosphodiesterase